MQLQELIDALETYRTPKATPPGALTLLARPSQDESLF